MTTKVHFGASLMALPGFDRDQLPVYTWSRTVSAIPRVGERVRFPVDLPDGRQARALFVVDEVTWTDDEEWDVSVHGNIAEAYLDDDAGPDLTPAQLADALGIRRLGPD